MGYCIWGLLVGLYRVEVGLLQVLGWQAPDHMGLRLMCRRFCLVESSVEHRPPGLSADSCLQGVLGRNVTQKVHSCDVRETCTPQVGFLGPFKANVGVRRSRACRLTR